MKRFCIAPLLAALALAPCQTVMAQKVEPTDAAVLSLRQAVTYQDSGVQHTLLVSLRALKDPAMKPIFEALLKAPQPPMRIDGFLGLAEIAGERGADPALLLKLGDAPLRTVAITECLGLGLLKPEGIRTLLANKELTAYDRALLVAELHRLHEPWDAAMLGDASASNTAEVAGLADLLMLEKGDQTRWEAFTKRLDEVDPAERTDLLRRLADASRHYELAKAAEALLTLTKDSKGADRIGAIAAALKVSPAAGREALLVMAQSDRGVTNLVQAGLLMLAADDAMQASDFDVLRGGQGVPDAIANAGQALRTPNADAAPALTALMESGNRAAAEWAVRQASKLPPETRRIMLLRAIDRLDSIDAPSMTDRLLSALAAQQLIGFAPEDLIPRVTRLSGKPFVPESIVAAMCDLGTPEAAKFARMVRGKLAQRGESMALVTIAKASPTLSPAELVELGRIGGGGGRVEEPIQMQAAWLFLKQSNKLAQATAKLTPR